MLIEEMPQNIIMYDINVLIIGEQSMNPPKRLRQATNPIYLL